MKVDFEELLKSSMETLYHVAEVIICFGVAAFALRWFGDFEGVHALAAGIVLNGLAKFARAHEGIPVRDFSNLD